jgi:hypothetical protein
MIRRCSVVLALSGAVIAAQSELPLVESNSPDCSPNVRHTLHGSDAANAHMKTLVAIRKIESIIRGNDERIDDKTITDRYDRPPLAARNPALFNQLGEHYQYLVT